MDMNMKPMAKKIMARIAIDSAMTQEDIAIRANVLSRFARRVWSGSEYAPSNSARSPLMALSFSYLVDRTDALLMHDILRIAPMERARLRPAPTIVALDMSSAKPVKLCVVRNAFKGGRAMTGVFTWIGSSWRTAQIQDLVKELPASISDKDLTAEYTAAVKAQRALEAKHS
jgi:hypothetical protein